MVDHFMHRREEFAKIFLVEKYLVFLVPGFVDAFTLGNSKEEIFSGARGLYIEKVRPFTSRNALGINLITVTTGISRTILSVNGVFLVTKLAITVRAV
jgi:hypothetical protein